MEKQKRWHLILIWAVFGLTLYNILPTVFYYMHPLHRPIDAPYANEVAVQIAGRVNELQQEAQDWLKAYCKQLSLRVNSITPDPKNPRWIAVSFQNDRDAELFRAVLPQAGNLIPFPPSQLELGPQIASDPNTVIVSRRVGIDLPTTGLDHLFCFSEKLDAKGHPTDFYRQLVDDRVVEVALALGGESPQARQLRLMAAHPQDPSNDDMALEIARQISTVQRVFGTENSIAKRIFASLTQTADANKETLLQGFIGRLDALSQRVEQEHKTLIQERDTLKKQGQPLEGKKTQQLAFLESQLDTLKNALSVLKTDSKSFLFQGEPFTRDSLWKALKEGASVYDPATGSQTLDLKGHHPFVDKLVIGWNDGTLGFSLYPDVLELRLKEATAEVDVYVRDRLNGFLVDEIARVSRLVEESILPDNQQFAIKLTTLTDSHSFLAFDIGQVATEETAQLLDTLKLTWNPTNTDLTRANYPLLTWDQYRKLPPAQQKLGLVVYAPAMEKELPPNGLRPSALYLIARGANSIAQKYQQHPESEEAKSFAEDLGALTKALQARGFIAYAGSSFGLAEEFRNDFIFELGDYYDNLLRATREDFSIHGSKRFALLEFTDVEQRILATNRIEDAQHEDLLKWKEAYDASLADPSSASRYYVCPPTRNVYWDNLKLTARKYFRGDDSKILRWGLDLSGGKSVRIGLRDQNNRVVTNPEDVKQAVNELYVRINKMGVAERSIRVENDNIILEFPGVQGLSATDLVKASAMYFHIVNEKFSPSSPEIGRYVNTFLQEVWNEAVVTNRKDIDSLNAIAWQHLGGEQGGQITRPRSEAAQVLVDNGLQLAAPNAPKSNAFNDTLSSIGRLRGEDFSEWHGQSHPLAILFHDYALEGSSLQDIQTGYDPSEGNVLMFGVKRSYEGRQPGSPREDFYRWTSQFAEDRISGTPKEQYTHGRGWRLAVVLNDEIINWPYLKAALRDAGTITGRFTQREVTKLASDLKAGSLSFTPKILSEYNISPELGKEERYRGILASLVGIALVVGVMVGYYRFAGLVASCAVLLTLPILWAVLQNLGAALSLPGIAGVVLTIGMAVDANVLIFERVREEFKISGKIGSALQIGYRKAFSAIIDSNLTTILATIIMIQFDCGPIKGFALTLTIGVIASMFTTLFLTHYYFLGWVKRGGKRLNMAELIHGTNIDFISMAKPAILISLVIMVVGGCLFVAQRNTILGMDFTGGYALTVDVAEKPGDNYRQAASQSLLAAGLSPNDFQVRTLSRPNQLLLELSTRLEETGHPFHGLPDELTKGDFQYDYQKNPRIVWVVNALHQGGVDIPSSSLPLLQANWTAMSGQLSDTMRNNAIFALVLAMVGVLIYVTFRFELKYGIGAIVGLIHDVVLTLCFLAWLRWLGMPVQIDLQVVGAIMVLIGYSLNDTIIVFDRIREDVRVLRKLTFPEVIRHALNVTLSRTILTSTTVFVVLLALVFLGGNTIFTFSLVMTMGVVIGTLSSLFISAPVMLYFHNREIAREEKRLALKNT